MKNHGPIPEFVELLLLLIAAAVLIYFVPVSINRVVFLFVFPLAWNSKRDYFWLAFFFVMLDYPGGLFHGGYREDIFRLPLYSIQPGISFALHELFFIFIFIKGWIKKKYDVNLSRSFFQNELKTLACLFVLLVAVSPLLGMSSNSYRNVYKTTIILSLFYSVFRTISTKEQLLRFFRIMFPFSFIAILLQVYSLINKQQLVALLKPGVTSVQGVFNIAGRGFLWERPIEMVHILLICFTGSLFLLFYTKHSFKRNYLVIVNLLSFLGIFLTGTRSWFLAFIAAYLLFFLITVRSSQKYLKYVLIVVPLIFIIFSTISALRNQIINAWSRLSTIEEVLGGDITAGGTTNRYNVKGPMLMKGFWSSSIVLGAGFSDHFYKFADGHVGYHNILLNSGIIGSFIFFIVVLKVLTFPFRMGKKYAFLNKPFVKLSIIPLFILLVINFGTQTIGFTPDSINRVFLMAFSILLMDLIIKSETKEFNKQIIQKSLPT